MTAVFPQDYRFHTPQTITSDSVNRPFLPVCYLDNTYEEICHEI